MLTLISRIFPKLFFSQCKSYFVDLFLICDSFCMLYRNPTRIDIPRSEAGGKAHGWPGEDTDWKKGEAILRAQQKKILARSHIFLKSPLLETPISFLRKLLSFRKWFQQIIAPTIEKTFCFFKTLSFWQNTFQKCFESVLLQQNTKLLCFAICLTIVITSVRTLLVYYYLMSSH